MSVPLSNEDYLANSNINNSFSTVYMPLLQEFPTDLVEDSKETSGFVKWKEKQKVEPSLFSTNSALEVKNQLVYLGAAGVYKDHFLISNSLNPCEHIDVFPSHVCPDFEIATHVANMSHIVDQLELKHKELEHLESFALLGFEDMHMDWKKRKRVELMHDDSNGSKFTYAGKGQNVNAFEVTNVLSLVFVDNTYDSRTNPFEEGENDVAQDSIKALRYQQWEYHQSNTNTKIKRRQRRRKRIKRRQHSRIVFPWRKRPFICITNVLILGRNILENVYYHLEDSIMPRRQWKRKRWKLEEQVCANGQFCA